MTVSVRPCGITVARVGVRRLHRHSPTPPVQGIAAFEAVVAGWPVGWAIVGRPVSRVMQARGYLEITRVATDGTRNACSALYGACARWARARGAMLLTYTLATESGASLRGAGWVETGRTDPGRSANWSRPSRAREGRRTDGVVKVRWSPPWCPGGKAAGRLAGSRPLAGNSDPPPPGSDEREGD